MLCRATPTPKRVLFSPSVVCASVLMTRGTPSSRARECVAVLQVEPFGRGVDFERGAGSRGRLEYGFVVGFHRLALAN